VFSAKSLFSFNKRCFQLAGLRDMKTVIFPLQKVSNHDTVPTIMGLEQEKILTEAEVRKLRRTL